jgi:hypothetical protein
MTDALHRDVAALLDKYRRELQDIEPGDDLDARIGVLVAGTRKKISPPATRPFGGARTWAAAAGLAALAITTGILIGMNLERGTPRLAQDALPVSADFSLWPADSVALQIPAEYSAQGKLVAVDPHAQSTGKRYWIDVVVSNDGTIRIDRIVPAEGTDGITLQNP